jgi:hypothetical protein
VGVTCPRYVQHPSEADLRAELSRIRRLAAGDSALAVSIALEALGGPEAHPRARVTSYCHSQAGFLISFDLVNPEPGDSVQVRDGSRTMYVDHGGCVTALGS